MNRSAGKAIGNGATGHRNRYLARILEEAAMGASKTNTFLGERYRRIAHRRGKKRALVAVGRSILTILWHLLADPNVVFIDLGPEHCPNGLRADQAVRNHIRGLNALGYTVTLNPAA